jgi:hypothetical protein
MCLAWLTSQRFRAIAARCSLWLIPAAMPAWFMPAGGAAPAEELAASAADVGTSATSAASAIARPPHPTSCRTSTVTPHGRRR